MSEINEKIHGIEDVSELVKENAKITKNFLEKTIQYYPNLIKDLKTKYNTDIIVKIKKKFIWHIESGYIYFCNNDKLYKLPWTEWNKWRHGDSQMVNYEHCQPLLNNKSYITILVTNNNNFSRTIIILDKDNQKDSSFYNEQ